MKQKVSVALLCAVVMAVSVSCSKDDTASVTESEMITEESCQTVRICYAVDHGTYQTQTIPFKKLDGFLSSIMSQTKEGHTISLYDAEQYQNMASKDVVTATFDTEKEAIEWMIKMLAQGYEVQVKEDPKTGIFTCEARK